MVRDNLNQLGKVLKQNNVKSTEALNKNRKIIPQIERVRDIVDSTVPIVLEFKMLRQNHRVLLDLNFMPPPKTGCCGGCTCAVCEFFDGGVTETTYHTTYAYTPGTVHVFKYNLTEKIPIEEFVESNPATGEVIVWAHTNDKIIICYVYSICL